MRAPATVARTIRPVAVGAALCAALVAADVARAEDGALKVSESAFNEFAEALEPIDVSGHKTLTITVSTFWGPVSLTVCDSDWTARVRNVDFEIRPNAIDVTADVEATWCGLDFEGTLETAGDVTFASAQQAVSVTVENTSLRPAFDVLGFEVELPAIDVGPTLTLPPLPIRTGRLYFESAAGATNLHISAENISVTKRNGYIELQSDVAVW